MDGQAMLATEQFIISISLKDTYNKPKHPCECCYMPDPLAQYKNMRAAGTDHNDVIARIFGLLAREVNYFKQQREKNVICPNACEWSEHVGSKEWFSSLDIRCELIS